MKKYQILVDSSADMPENYLENSEIGFNVVPLSIYVGEEEFIDDKDLNTAELVKKMNNCKEKMRTACPSVDAWNQYFDNAEHTFVVTMTGQLSGTFNSAVVATNEAKNKGNIHVFDTKSTSGTLELVVDHIVSLINEGKEFNEIVESTENFIGTRNLFFILHKFDNLIANGRMSKFAGLVAKTLVIRPICTASKKGTIEISNKCIGALNAYKKLAELCTLRCDDFENRKLIITHCFNPEDAEKIKELVTAKCNFKEVVIKPMRGLTSFYAQEKGIIICF